MMALRHSRNLAATRDFTLGQRARLDVVRAACLRGRQQRREWITAQDRTDPVSTGASPSRSIAVQGAPPPRHDLRHDRPDRRARQGGRARLCGHRSGRLGDRRDRRRMSCSTGHQYPPGLPGRARRRTVAQASTPPIALSRGTGQAAVHHRPQPRCGARHSGGAARRAATQLRRTRLWLRHAAGRQRQFRDDYNACRRQRYPARRCHLSPGARPRHRRARADVLSVIAMSAACSAATAMRSSTAQDCRPGRPTIRSSRTASCDEILARFGRRLCSASSVVLLQAADDPAELAAAPSRACRRRGHGPLGEWLRLLPPLIREHLQDRYIAALTP